MVHNLRRRSAILRSLRQFFDDRQFCEVQTPVLSADTIVDRYIEPVAVHNGGLPVNHHGNRTYYLQTSPEFAMKRLLMTAQEQAIYQITPVFRLGDRGQFHNIEFTMLEWYRLGDGYQTGMGLLADLVQHLGFAKPEQVRYADLFQEQNRQDSAMDDLFFYENIQPKLTNHIICDYPAAESQLAKINNGVAERFELFLDGIEIANGYNELSDADECERRLKINSGQRLAGGKPALPVASRLLDAMRICGLPQCSGTALGVDRLVQVILKAKNIDEVLTFPIETA